MQLRLDALEGHLKQASTKGLAPLYVVHGDEHLLVLEAVDALRQAARAQGFSEREVMSVERGFSWSRVTEAQQSMSLFGDRKIVELRIPSGKPGKDGGEALRALAAGTPSGPATDTITLITLPRLDFATAKSAWFAALEGAGVSIKVDTVDRTKLPGWIGERLARQQQRVELARALIMEPRVLLLDEPLSALDPFLRTQMRAELRRWQQELGLTFVHVTHSQEEAMALADQMVVMNQGRIEQAGSRVVVAAVDITDHEALEDVIAQAEQEHGPVRLTLPVAKCVPPVVDQLKDVLADHPGTVEVQLHLVNDGRTTVLRLDDRLRVSPGPALYGDLKALLGSGVLG